jgi:hypothetical protein
MATSEIESTRRLKLEQWQDNWQLGWKKHGPPDYALTPTGEVASHQWEQDFLATARSPDGEKKRLDRIAQEFSMGFERLYRARACCNGVRIGKVQRWKQQLPLGRGGRT